MSENVQVRLVALHDAVAIVDLLCQAYCVNLAAYAADFARILATVRVGVREINGGVAGPLRMSRVGIGNAVLPVIPVAMDAGQREAL